MTFRQEKRFPDGSTELILKDGYLQSTKSQEKARVTRFFNELEKISRVERLTKELNETTFLEPRKRRKLELELSLVNIENYKRSARRARQVLYDICKCNEFDYFVTLTFDNEKLDRLDDSKTRRKFSQWANAVRKQFPNMYYVATPEYHKKGGLHFHLLVGGVTMEELKAVPAISKRGREIYKNGKQIYNITAWRWGFSTLSKIENAEATKHYICKYITKQHFDDRFFGKRRYYCSANIVRPEIVKDHCGTWSIDLDVWQVAYLDEYKKYGVFRHDGTGIVDREYNTEGVRKMVERVKSGAARGSEARAARVPYSTVGTLNSEHVMEETQKQFAELEAEYKRQKAKRGLLKVTKEDTDLLREIGLIA